MGRGRPKGTCSCFYTVYNNRTDKLVCLDATAEEAAQAMGVTLKTFRPLVTRTLRGEKNEWHIEKTDKKEVIE